MPVTLPQLIIGILIPVFVIALYGLVSLPKDEDYMRKILRPVTIVAALVILLTLGIVVF